MKRVLLVGGPADGQVKTIDDGLHTLLVKVPQRFNFLYEERRDTVPSPPPLHRYIEVVFGEQRPLRVFKLESMQDDDVIHRLADFYAKGHDTYE